MYRADILFNVLDMEVDKAIVALENPQEGKWPLDIINNALYIFYEYGSSPWIYTVTDDNGTIGYIVRERDDLLTQEQLYDALIGISVEEGMFNEEELTFTQPVPFAFQGNWDGAIVGVVASPQRYGARFPSEPINEAISRLMGQGDWEPTKQLYLYPVKKENSPQISGLIIQTSVDNVGEGGYIDDALFREIAQQNEPEKYPVGFQPERFTVYE